MEVIFPNSSRGFQIGALTPIISQEKWLIEIVADRLELAASFGASTKGSLGHFFTNTQL